MKAACPRLVIAGSGSGVGKTSLTLGLARWLARQGLRVQTFKVGPISSIRATWRWLRAGLATTWTAG